MTVQEGQPVTEPMKPVEAPIWVGPDLVAEAGLPHVDETTRVRVFEAFDAAAPSPAPVSVPSDDLRKQVNELGALARSLFEAQFARCEGGRMPADPTWDDLEPSERDDFWEQARNAAHVFGPRSVSVPGDREVVTICGSMRFFDDMLKVAEEETAAGRIVLAPFSVVAPEDQGGTFKAMLDDLHRRKIDLSAGIIVVTRGGYIGESTRGEIAYAESTGKTVRYVETQSADPVAAPAVDRSKLRNQIHAALDTARNRGERHPDEADTGDLVDAVMGPVDEWDDALHDDLKDENERLRALHHTPYVDAEHQGGNCVDVIMAQAAEIARLTAEFATAREELGQAFNQMRAEHTAVSAALWKALKSDSGCMRGYSLVDLVETLAAQRDDLEDQAADRLPAAQPGTVAELTELLVAASSEWDDNTGDDETSRPYLEYLAQAIATARRPVPAEQEGRTR